THSQPRRYRFVDWWKQQQSVKWNLVAISVGSVWHRCPKYQYGRLSDYGRFTASREYDAVSGGHLYHFALWNISHSELGRTRFGRNLELLCCLIFRAQ